MSGVNIENIINILDKVEPLVTWNLEFWISGVNNDPTIQTRYAM